MWPSVVVCVLAVGALLWCAKIDFRPGVWIAKPIASTAFLTAALANGALDSLYGIFIFVGLVLSWFGDVLLIPKSGKSFVAGVGAFLAGHIAYVVAFLARGIVPFVTLVAGALLVVPVVRVMRWLAPHVPANMRLPIQAYVTVITTMLMTAAGAAFSSGDPWILVGALAFYVSDLAVAREQFVSKTWTNKIWGLPLYYGGQLVLAATVAAPTP